MAKIIPSDISKLQFLRVLMVEDSESDELLIIRELKKGGYKPEYERVETAAAMKKALKEKQWDIILCDYRMPEFNALSAIDLLKGTNIDIPLIIVSGAIGEEVAVECMRLGAHDYIMKGNLSRLCPAIARELEEADSRNKRKKAEEARQESEERFRQISSLTSDIAYSCSTNEDGHFLIDWMVGATEKISGYSIEEIKAQSCWRFLVLEEDMDLFEKNVIDLAPGSHALCELRIRHKNGSIVWIASSTECFMTMETPEHFVLYGALVDITERKHVQGVLLESEEKYRTILESIQEGYFEVDFAGNLTFFNDSLRRFFGYSKEELMGMNNRQYTDKENSKKLFQAFNKVYKTGESTEGFDWQIIRKDGTKRYVEASVSLQKDSSGKPIGFRGIVRDVTGRKQVEAALQKSEANYRQLFDNAPAAIYQIDFRTGKFLKANDIICEYFGCSQEEITSLSPYDLLTKESQKLFLERLNKMATGDKVPEDPEYEFIDKNGKPRWLKLNSKNIYDSEGLAGANVVAHDITERKQSEKTLKESENKYRLLADNIQDVIFVLDMNLKYTYISPSVKTMRGYEPEEVLKQQSIERVLTPSSMDLAIKTISEIMDMEKSGFKENLPLSRTLQLEMRRKDGTTLWTDVKFSFIRDENNQPVAIMGVTRDITERKLVEEQLHQILENLRKSFGATVQVMVSAVEARDPYTAGHQLRVADLARTIATEMGLAPDKIEGIRMAGSIHDIGKLSIPAEILSKPTKLTDIEFSLIKEHPRIGYEMLKDVESPWPLAQIVYQHHERMNGSGYPRNIKGDEILMEARIMAVADVVEAMASHRPYRPALGIEVALEEIEKNKGIIYDDTVVDACLRLFREKGYQFT